MPKRTDIHNILIIGSGPIVIGQACEFDYSGTQACKALREEGFGVVLINSNPATIMTDPQFADRTYIEPITPEAIDKILTLEARRGHPVDALLPTLGGQTGLNCAVACYDGGILKKHNVPMIGADRKAIEKAESRTAFKAAMQRIGLDVPQSAVVHTWEEAQEVVFGTAIKNQKSKIKNLPSVPLPVCIRPAFTLGGTGGGFAFTPEEFETIAKRGLALSPVHEILIEESCLGWKEYELEVMRDQADNVVIICSIENFDPMGVHTGDSITVAPIQTLSDKEYQLMRDASIKIIREIGVETGGSNIQFAVHPETGRMIVIEMNPRVSRSSALASKATGYPIARIAAKLAVGYTLDELPNEITKSTRASFEPVIDYCVVKIPRFTFEKFPEADETLTTQMKSVGEAMSIGRTFKEALQKGIRSMEIKRTGYGLDRIDKWFAAQKIADCRLPIADLKGVSSAKQSAIENRQLAILGGSTQAEAPADTEEKAATNWPIPLDVLHEKLAIPCQGRLYYVRYAFKMGWTVEQVFAQTKIDPWFLDQLQQLVEFEQKLVEIEKNSPRFADKEFEKDAKSAQYADLLRQAKQWGYSDMQLAQVWHTTPAKIRAMRQTWGIIPVYKLVDTCSAEFVARTPYYYSSYETPSEVTSNEGNDERGEAESRAQRVERKKDNRQLANGNRQSLDFSSLVTHHSPLTDDEIRITEKKKVVILGGGPNRIGQGIEFDYCCVHAAMAARELGYEAIMVNSNPETVSTDFDTSDMLFFEPLTHEDVLNICERFMPKDEAKTGSSSSLIPHPSSLLAGVITQFGGQTPLNLARGLHDAGVPLLGTSVESIELAEDREKFQKILHELGLRQPPNGTARTLAEAKAVAAKIGYPVLIRPGFVLGGRGMEICTDDKHLGRFMQEAIDASEKSIEENPVLIDKFLDVAIEVDVDAVADGTGAVVIAGILEHIEEAGVHSGDAAMSLPPYSLSPLVMDEIREATIALARRLNVKGLMNVQYAVRDGVLYVLEVNPRASRTVPFVAKATGISWAKVAAKIMLGKTLAEQGIAGAGGMAVLPGRVAVKESVFPFTKFPGVDVILGPEMRSTGEVMGMDKNFALAFAKSQMASGNPLPLGGTAYLSVRDADKPAIVTVAAKLAELGFCLRASEGTAKAIKAGGVKVEAVPRISSNRHPNLLDLIRDKKVDIIINTPTRKGKATDEGKMRAAAVMAGVLMMTTVPAGLAAARAIEALKSGDWDVRALQDYY